MTKAVKGSAKNATNGVVLSKVKRDCVERASLHYCPGELVGPSVHVETIVVRLATHFEVNHPDTLVECDVCEGFSPEDVPGGACPFCGTVDDEDEVVPAETPTSPAAPMAKTKGPAKGKQKAVTIVSQGHVEVITKDLTVATAPEVLASVSSVLVGRMTAASLNDAVAEVVRLKGEGACISWELGARIKVIFDSQLYKQRLGPDGKTPAYKGFDPFCVAELGITSTYAYRLMDISRDFDEAAVRRFGTAKLGLLLMAPDTAKEKILKKMEEGATKREVAEEVKKARKDSVEPRAPTGRKETPKGPGRRLEKITVANVVGKKTIKLFKKVVKKKAEPERARTLQDGPWGKHELENGVVQYFALQETTAGELVLVVDTRRVEGSDH